ncbi:MAG: ATP-binding cassette domain-containing protein, partial [Pseudomonadota bacterium]
ARHHGLEARGFSIEPRRMADFSLPAMAFVNFCHFVVVEGFNRNGVYLNDPARGPVRVSWSEFEEMFSGIYLTFKPGENFQRGQSVGPSPETLGRRLEGLRGLGILALLVSVTLVVPGVLMPVFNRVFVDYVLVRGLDGWMAPLIGGMLAAAVLRIALTYLQARCLSAFELNAAARGAVGLLRHVLSLPIAFFAQRYAGEVMTRVELNDDLAKVMGGDAAKATLDLTSLAFFLLVMLLFSPLLTAVTLVGTAISIGAIIASTRMLADGHRAIAAEEGKARAAAAGGLRDMETFKAAGAEDAFFRRWAGLAANALSAEQVVRRRLATVTALPALSDAVTIAVILGLGGYLVMNGALTLGELVAFQGLSAGFAAPVAALAGSLAELQAAPAKLARVRDVEAHPPDRRFAEAEPDNTKPTAPTDRSAPAYQIQLSGVSFGYAPLERPLLNDIDLVIPAGARIAFVGASGSGKSTLGKLIAGLLEPSAGTIMLDGRPYASWSRTEFSERVGYVDQDIMLFDGTVSENLTLFDEDSIDEADLVLAAERSAVLPAVMRRPAAFNTSVSEGGRNFSGGERQRLEIARVLVRDPSVLVLDEATSALDPPTEARVMEGISATGATLIVIAHRLSTIRDSDEIIVLDGGVVVERGTHDALYEAGGAYWALFNS